MPVCVSRCRDPAQRIAHPGVGLSEAEQVLPAFRFKDTVTKGNKMRLQILTIAVLAVSPAVAFAQAADFEMLDIDNNGGLSMAELTAEYPRFEESHMALIDSDENLLVDSGEYLIALESNVLDTVFGVQGSVGDGGN
ncbi:hypothetical protein OEW28_09430 [Defluviimonas sp. WL0002]|uniref:EF-hand domain-containing protein n=1 Tax=Albidovulum marisflavi TaxID=2984159 RepID=A0ABT2ZCQ7_9RHOB|nr:hypothetical protein [Defluviimonas sp. WL0002]MCV2868848.1 hypothetical protein [Defluviimonas sp. WL0002]